MNDNIFKYNDIVICLLCLILRQCYLLLVKKETSRISNNFSMSKRILDISNQNETVQVNNETSRNSNNCSISNSNVGISNQSGIIIMRGDVNVNTSSNKSDHCFDLPPEIKTFYGRDKELINLKLCFKETNKVVISGLRGIGKSALANRFAREYMEEKKIDIAFWLDLENKENPMQSLELVKNIYKQNKERKCLFIFDGPLNRHAIVGSEPESNNHLLLITSCNKDWDYDIKNFHLKPLTDTRFAIKIFETILGDTYYTPKQNYLYEDLAKTFDNIPLALELIARTIRNLWQSLGGRFVLENWVKNVKADRKPQLKEILTKFISENTANNYNKTLLDVVKISIKNMRENTNMDSNLTINSLFICAFLNINCIYFENLFEILHIDKLKPLTENYLYRELNFDELASKSNDEESLGKTLNYLDKHSLIKYSPPPFQEDLSLLVENPDSIKILKTIQKILQFYMNQEEKEQGKACYRYCLNITIRNLSHISTILQFADDYIEDFKHFYNEYQSILLDENIKLNTLTTEQDYENKIREYTSPETLFQMILYSLISPGCIECLKLLREYCGDSKFADYINNFNLLHYSIYHGQLNILALLLECDDVDINKKNENNDYNTPLHVAAEYRKIEAIDILLKKGANKYEENSKGITALVSFMQSGYSIKLTSNIVNKYVEKLNVPSRRNTA